MGVTLTPCEHVGGEQRTVIWEDDSLGRCWADFWACCGLILRWRPAVEQETAQDHINRWMVDEGRWNRAKLSDGTMYDPSPPGPEQARLPVRYVDKAMFAAEPVEADAMKAPKVYLLSATPDPLGAVAAMCMMYEGKVCRRLADVTDEQREHYWDQVQRTHLKAPLEAIDLHFMIEGVTRAWTHQAVRQRTAVYAQESMRFAVKDEIAARPGPLVGQMAAAETIWREAIDNVWAAYKALIAAGVPAEEARGLLPHDTLTRLNFKTNLRNLADHLGNRLCTQAQFEWRLVAAQMRQAIHYYQGPMTTAAECYGLTGDFEGVEPKFGCAWQFELIAASSLFQPVCFALGHCPFNADFDRGCTIRERVEAGDFEAIRVEEWMADPTAGWVR